MQENQNNNEPRNTMLSKVLVILIMIVIGFIGFKYMNFPAKSKDVVVAKQHKSAVMQQEESVKPQLIANASLTADDVKTIVSQYLNDNPEVVMEALRKLEARAIAEKSKNAEEFVNKNTEKLIVDRPYLGNKDGKLIVIKFFDYKCGYCKRSHITLERIIKEYPNVKVVLENTPILGEKSTLASKASIAFWALSPDKFDKFHAELMNMSDISESSIETLAKKYGVAKAPLFNMMGSSKVQDKINENIKLAQQVGVQGVPAFIINGKFIPGSMSYEEFKEKLDEGQKSPSGQ